jgi:hypothetical protein
MSPVFAMTHDSPRRANRPLIHLRGTPRLSRKPCERGFNRPATPLTKCPVPEIGLTVRKRSWCRYLAFGRAPGRAASTPRAVPNDICQMRPERGGQNDSQERPGRTTSRGELELADSERSVHLGHGSTTAMRRHSSKPLNPFIIRIWVVDWA